MREIFLVFMLILSFGWIIFNLVKINILKSNVFKKKFDDLTTYQVYTSGERGIIFDRNNKELVYNQQQLNIIIRKSRFYILSYKEKEYLKNFLKQNLSIDNIENIFSNTYTDKVIIKKEATFKDISLVTENMMYVYGLEVDISSKRKYLSSAFSFITGFVNVPYKEDIEKDESLQFYEEVGKYGLELEYDHILRGKLGLSKYLIDPSGQPIKTIYETIPQKGKDLITTIDKDIQQYSYKELKTLCDSLSFKNNQPVGGSLILMKTNGEILTLISYPSFDPNTLKPDYNEIIKKYPNFSYFYNRAINGEYPAASTFKIITSLAALEEKIINKDTQIYCGGVFYIGGHPFYCFQTSGHGSLNLVKALALSCDVFYYTLGYKLKIEKIKYYSELLGLNSKTGIDLPYESKGLIPSRKWKKETLNEEWNSGDDVNTSIGQGFVLVTPIQMAVVVNSIATNYKVKPFLNLNQKPTLIKLNLNQKNLDYIRKGMEEAINEGTAIVIKSFVKKYKVAGKTGTAEVPINENNPKGLNNTWFVGYFGKKEPEYVIVVSLEGSGGYGGQYAATLAAKVIHFMEENEKNQGG